MPMKWLNIRDHRGYYEGSLWSTEMPSSTFFAQLGEPLHLILAQDDIRLIRVLSRQITNPDLTSKNGECEFFEASFMADINIRKLQ